VDWINLTGAKKVHSLIDKVYKRKEPGDGLGEGESEPGKVRSRWADSGGFRSATGATAGSLQRELKEDTYSASAGSTTPHSEEGQTGEYRMLGIPAIYDRRVASKALLNRLEPSSSRYSMMPASDTGEGDRRRTLCGKCGKRFKAGPSGS